MRTRFWLCAMLVSLVTLPEQGSAQRADSTRAGVSRPAERVAADTAHRGRVSPRRAFLTSLLVPGSMQIRFGRPIATAIFLMAEAGSVGMSVKSWNDLSKAKDARADTVATTHLDGEGNPLLDPVTGLPIITFGPRNKNLADRVAARRAHLEDWIAVVVFNHLFAGADAYVAANLADFDANVQVSSAERRVGFAARVAWRR